MMIHRTAIVHPDAHLDVDVQVGAYSVIGPGVSIGKGTVIGNHAEISCNTKMGQDNKVFSYTSIGGEAQDLTYKGQDSHIIIGDRNIFREFATINRGCHGEALTTVGSDCMFMISSHIGHDCRVGNNVVMANQVALSGHTIVEDRVTIGGISGTHQFVRIGKMAMIGGASSLLRDIPPFCIVQGNAPAKVRGLNSVGLKRNGVSKEAISGLKTAFRLMFRSGMSKKDALEQIAESIESSDELAHFVDFISAKSKRGVYRGDST